jgi:hypothetical protein
MVRSAVALAAARLEPWARNARAKATSAQLASFASSSVMRATTLAQSPGRG